MIKTACTKRSSVWKPRYPTRCSVPLVPLIHGNLLMSAMRAGARLTKTIWPEVCFNYNGVSTISQPKSWYKFGVGVKGSNTWICFMAWWFWKQLWTHHVLEDNRTSYSGLAFYIHRPSQRSGWIRQESDLASLSTLALVACAVALVARKVCSCPRNAVQSDRKSKNTRSMEMSWFGFL
jgi:hypothetical protein